MTNSRAYTTEEIQDTLISNCLELVPYWVNTTHYHYKNRPLSERMSGIMHSLYAVAAGSSGAFSSSLDFNVYSTEEAKARSIALGQNWFPVNIANAVDINDGGLQYVSADRVPEYKKIVTEEIGMEPSEMTASEMRYAFFVKIYDSLVYWEAHKELSELDRAANMVRDFFILCEKGAPDWDARIELVTRPHPEDKEYFIGLGENYYEETTLTDIGEGRSLLQLWDEGWATTRLHYQS